MMRNAFRIILTSLLLLLSFGAFAQEEGQGYISSLFLKANEAYDRGVDLTGKDREEALQTAVANYEKIIRQGETRNGYLYYNLGNAYYQLGHVGNAILNYRKAEQFIPNYDDLNENLRAAIAKRKDNIEKSQIDSIWHTLFFWHYLISLRAKIVLLAVCFTLVWVLLFVRLLVARSLLKWLAIFAAIVSVMLGTSLAAEVHSKTHTRHGVITSEEVDARKGPYTNAESEFTRPLHEGTEFRVLDERGDWYHIELDNGISTWIPKDACGLIQD